MGSACDWGRWLRGAEEVDQQLISTAAAGQLSNGVTDMCYEAIHSIEVYPQSPYSFSSTSRERDWYHTAQQSHMYYWRTFVLSIKSQIFSSSWFIILYFT
jgi:hypothetical protein